MLIDKLHGIVDKYQRLEEQLSDPEVLSDMGRFKKVNKEYKDLQPLVTAYQKYKLLLGAIDTAEEMQREPDDEMKTLAAAELELLLPQRDTLEDEIKVLLTPKDPDDEKDVIFEVRSGTGGDEASLFAGDLYRMYSRYFDTQGWKVDVLFVNEGTVGGYNKLVLEISGTDVYGKLKFESGGHRVQRVPETEAKGRVHTSAATVAVMPKFEMEEININPADLRVDVFRSSGAGGQHVNRTESAVRITHIPSGVVSECQEGRSQIQNREIAMQRLYQRLQDAQVLQHQSEQSAKRRSLVGSGDRSEKVRTYNFPQNRLTDHRINLTLYNLDQIMEGNLEEIIEALRVADTAERMKEETV
ncbi:MAG: peptide chain release factor 1 [Saprospiraceae bacterium]|nr:peptide chain release factor 1 [Saprospiraceae bacterium]MBP7679576.1 peptide chain release factor 1 [Saprospiraceae bacterium]